jgi:hypothetical protein
MLTPERELAAAVYILYAADCVHWLKAGQAAVTRRPGGRWSLHEHTDASYTLLGWMPVVVNPFDLRPSFAWAHPGESTSTPNEAAHELLRRELPNIDSLTLVSIIGCLNLLVVFPAVLITGLFPVPFLIPAIIAGSVHVTLAVDVFIQGAKWRRADRAGFWRQYLPLLLNPIAALRSGDVMLKAASEREIGRTVNAGPTSDPMSH